MTSNFVVRVDPVLGYCIEGTYDVLFRQRPEGVKMGGWAFCPGNYVPWPEHAVYDRTVYCPGGETGYRGWANNLIAMDRADANRKVFTWRDKGFIAYLNPRTGWSPCRTRHDGGPDCRMSLCNAHNDFHINISLPAELPKDKRGWYHYRAVHRLQYRLDRLLVRRRLLNVGHGAERIEQALAAPA